MEYVIKGEIVWGGEECWFKMFIDIICGYVGFLEFLFFLLNCMYGLLCFRLCFDIID